MKKTSFALGLGMIFLVTTACVVAPKQQVVGIAMPETHLLRWINDGNNMKVGLEERGYQVELAYADADQTKQNQQIQAFITKGINAIIVASVDEGVNQAVGDAKAAGIPVITYDRLMVGSDASDYYITFDNFKVGVLQGEVIVTALGLNKGVKGKRIILFAGSPTDNNARMFYDGAMSMLKKYIDSGALIVVGPRPLSSDDPTWSKITTDKWQGDLAKQRMESLLASVARDVIIDAVLTPNDAIARSVYEALSSDSKYDKVPPILTGQDVELLSCRYIIEGKQYMSVLKDSKVESMATVDVVDNILKKKEITVSVPHILDTKSYNKDNPRLKSYLLTPQIVTKDNYKEILVNTGIYTEEQLKQGK